MVIHTVVALVAAGALAPAAAQTTPKLSLNQTCYVAKKSIKVTGSGFAPGATVTLSGGASGSVVADPGGAFTKQLAAPALRGDAIAPKIFTLTARDAASQASLASVAFPVIRGYFLTNAPISGRPSEKTTWRFAGFTPNGPIWGHFRLKGRTVRDYHFGTARGACGTAVVRAPRVPVRTLRAGTWTLVLDQFPRYSGAHFHRTIRFRIYRTLQ